MSPEDVNGAAPGPDGSGADTNSMATPACPNCGARLQGPYCHQCGQHQRDVDRFFLALVSEAFEDVFSWNSRTRKTLFALLFRPGFLTAEYFAGRRARYVPPLRLYLIASVSFFFLISLLNLLDNPEPDALSSIITNESGPDATEADSWPDDLRSRVETFHIDSLSASQNAVVRDRLLVQTNKLIRIAEEDPTELLDQLLEVAPPILFVLLPVFALLLKIVYFSSGKYYTEHLVLALHNHSFLFVVLALESLLDFIPAADTITALLSLWIPIYMYLSLRVIYTHGYFTTFINFAILGMLYLMLVLVGTAVAFVVGVMAL